MVKKLRKFIEMEKISEELSGGYVSIDDEESEDLLAWLKKHNKEVAEVYPQFLKAIHDHSDIVDEGVDLERFIMALNMLLKIAQGNV